jgi:hypothetical protein
MADASPWGARRRREPVCRQLKEAQCARCCAGVAVANFPRAIEDAKTHLGKASEMPRAGVPHAPSAADYARALGITSATESKANNKPILVLFSFTHHPTYHGLGANNIVPCSRPYNLHAASAIAAATSRHIPFSSHPALLTEAWRACSRASEPVARARLKRHLEAYTQRCQTGH